MSPLASAQGPGRGQGPYHTVPDTLGLNNAPFSWRFLAPSRFFIHPGLREKGLSADNLSPSPQHPDLCLPGVGRGEQAVDRAIQPRGATARSGCSRPG